MRLSKKNHRLATILIAGTLFAIVGATLCRAPYASADCDGIQTSIINCNSASDSTGSPIVAVLIVAIQIMTGLIGIVAIGAFVYAGIMYSAASGNASQVAKAKEIIRNTVIGLFVFAAMVLLLNWLIPGGLFTGSAKFGAGGNGESSVSTEITNEADDSDDDTTVTNGACYWNYSAGYPSGKLFHIDNTKNATTTNSYAFEDSPEGVKYASKHGYKRIDIDIQTTKDNVVVAVHSTNPFMTRGNGTWGGFYDPSGEIKKGTIQDLTYAQVSRLRHKVGGYRIHKIEDIIATAKETGMTIAFELKTPKTLKSHMSSITAMVNEAHIKVMFMGLVNKAGQASALQEARKHGFWALYLYTGKQGPIKSNACGK